MIESEDDTDENSLIETIVTIEPSGAMIAANPTQNTNEASNYDEDSAAWMKE